MLLNIRHIISIALISTLTGCGAFPFCISQHDVDNVNVNIQVPTKPDKNDGSVESYWFDSGVTIPEGETASFVLRDYGTVNFCVGKDGPNGKIHTQVASIDKDTGNSGSNILLYPGDSFFINLKPYASLTPNTTTCNNGYDENFYFGSANTEKCNKMVDENTKVDINIGNYDGTPNSNVWTKFGAVSWLNGKLFNFDSEISQHLEECSDPLIYNNDSYSLNSKCGAICRQGLTENCFYSLAPVDENDKSQGSYLQGLKGRIVSASGETLQELETFGNLSEDSKGVKLGYPYSAKQPGYLNLYFYEYFNKLFKVDNRSNANIEIKYHYIYTTAWGDSRLSSFWAIGDENPIDNLSSRASGSFDFKSTTSVAASELRKARVALRVNGSDICSFDVSNGLGPAQIVVEKPPEEIPTNVIIDENLNCSFSYGRSERSGSSGGYRVTINKSCTDAAKGSLYYYVGDRPPPVMPGFVGTSKVNIPEDGSIPYKFDISSSGKGGRVFFGVKDNGDGYDNNGGYYSLSSTVPREGTDVISFMIRLIRDSVINLMYGGNNNDYQDKYRSPVNSGSKGVVGLSFEGITKNAEFIRIIQAVIAVSIAMYGILFMFGMLKMPQLEFLVLILKITAVLMLIQPNSWFFFKYYLFDLFINGGAELINMVSGQFDGNARDFHFLDKFLFKLIIPETWLQLLSIFFVPGVGFIIVFVILYGLWAYISAIFDAICIYLVSVVAIAFMLLLSPVFIAFLLFKRTKQFFDAWVKSMAQAVGQPVLVFAGLGILLEIGRQTLHNLLNFEACQGCVLRIAESDALEQFLCIFTFFVPYGVSPSVALPELLEETGRAISFFGLPINISSLIMFIFLATATKKFIGFTGQMGLTIFGAPGADMVGAGQNVSNQIKGLAGQDDFTQQGLDRQDADDQERQGKVTRSSIEDKPSPDDLSSRNPIKSGPGNNPSDQGGNNPIGGGQNNNNTSDKGGNPIGGSGIGISGSGDSGGGGIGVPGSGESSGDIGRNTPSGGGGNVG